jgi:hypothetical protein
MEKKVQLDEKTLRDSFKNQIPQAENTPGIKTASKDTKKEISTNPINWMDMDFPASPYDEN